MKNMVVSIALLLGTVSASATTQDVTVCSVGREGQIYTSEFRVEGSQVTMIDDGVEHGYQIVSKTGVNLKAASAVAGERVIQATQYVISSPQGTTTLQIAQGESRTDYMLFMQNGIMGASSANCK